jgi:CrcB protein
MQERAVTVGVVAVGGAFGALTRHSLSVVGGTPERTLAANVVGSLLLGLLAARALPDSVQLFAATGFCSSFTTYSTFAVETVSLGPRLGALYVAVTYTVGLLAATVGVAGGRRV